MTRRNGDQAPEPKLLLLPREAAALAGVGKATVYYWIHRGELPVVVVGRSRFLVPRKALETFVAERAKPLDGEGT
jgi:excisionase family DNA binding protein